MTDETADRGDCATMAASAVSALPSASPDAELIYMHGECVRLEREYGLLCTAIKAAEGEDDQERVTELEREREAVDDAVKRTKVRFAATPAQTIVGLHLKLDFSRSSEIFDVGEIPPGDLDMSALHDAKRLAEASGVPDPVVELAAQYHAVSGDHSHLSDDEFDVHREATVAPLLAALGTTRPTTVAGAAAALGIALSYMSQSDGKDIDNIVRNVCNALSGAAVGAMVPINDPIFEFIKALEKPRAAITSKKEHVAALRAKMPAEIGNWVDCVSSEEAAERAQTHTEWYERVGMPFTPDTEDDYWEADFAAYNAAELALIEARPRTVAGFTRKVAILWRFRLEIEGKTDWPGYIEAVETRGQLSSEAMLAAFARDAAALIERLVNGRAS